MGHNYPQLAVILLGITCIIGVQSQERCVNPLGESGACIYIRKCQPLLELLVTHGTSVSEFLLQSRCGNGNDDSSNPRVCCPGVGTSGNGEDGRIVPERPKPNNSQYWPLYAPTCGVSNHTYTRVVGGVPASLGAWPWIAALGYRSTSNPNKPRWLCGGSLVSSRHVITAAHCVHRRDDLFMVRLGDLNLDDNVNDGATPVDVPIDQKHEHPQYSATQYTNDIAVLRLKWEVEFTDLIKPICLPLAQDIREMSFVDTLPFIAGWGSIYFRGPSASHLQQLQVPVVPTDKCKSAFTRFKTAVIDDRVLCAGYARGGKDACQGDSGGPLMYPKQKVFYSIGVVSYGYRCAEPGIPGVYTKVSQFIDFITSRLN